MTTVSLVEYYSPASLRTCGSSVSSFIQNRKRLKCASTEKKTTAVLSRNQVIHGSPDLFERSSVSPYQLSLDGVTSPLQNLSPQHTRSSIYSRPSTRWNDTKFPCPVASSESSSSCPSEDSFSDVDLEKFESQTSHETLQIIGSKPKLFDPYQVPQLSKSKHSSQQHVIQTSISPKQEEKDDRKTIESPDNPPPSPVNFQSSVEGFVVGGNKIMGLKTGHDKPSYSDPGRLDGIDVISYKTKVNDYEHESRDFVPGFVKQPLYNCGKCAIKCVEEERSQSVLQQRISQIVQNRVSPYRYNTDNLVDCKIRNGQTRNQVLAAIQTSFQSPTSEASSRTFLEIYNEKKRQKEEKDKEIKKKQEIMKNQKREITARARRRLQQMENFENEKLKRTNKQSKKEPCVVNEKNPFDSIGKEVIKPDILEPTDISDLSTADIVIDFETEQEHDSQSTKKLSRKVQTNCKVRKCMSDIWPFPCQTGSLSVGNSGDFTCLSSTDLTSLKRNKHISPYLSLPSNIALALDRQEKSNIENVDLSNSNESMCSTTSKSSTYLTETYSYGTVLLENSKERDRSDVNWSRESQTKGAMTAVITVPQQNSQEEDEPCDTFLTRLQISKRVSAPDQSLPANSQFCFEAMVDKRYNRWKRRRRKKKEVEFQRSFMPPLSDSSDENEEITDRRNKAVERIIARMYEKINGCPRKAQFVSGDTKRMRTMRPCQDESRKPENPGFVNYDAGSEWTSSDSTLPSSSSGQCIGNLTRITPENSDSVFLSDNLCTWPYIEHYKQEIMKIINETPQDKLDDLTKNDWLPDIIPHNERTIKPEESSDTIASVESQTQLVQESILSVRNRSNTPDTQSCTLESGSTMQVASDNSICYSKWPRSNRSTRDSCDEDKPVFRSMTSASNWSEMGLNHGQSKREETVPVRENGGPAMFKAPMRPIKQPNVHESSSTRQTKKQKETRPCKARVNLPTLSKSSKLQTVPKLVGLKRSKTPKNDMILKVVKVSEPVRDKISRPKTQPRLRKRGRTTEQGYHMTGERDLMFRDYYLRSLYSKTNRVNSHRKSFNTGSIPKKTVTVNNLDLGNKDSKKFGDSLSNLSFTRSFTFSMFDLPDIYRYYNTQVNRKAKGGKVT